MEPFLAIPCNTLIIRTNNHPIITRQSPAPESSPLNLHPKPSPVCRQSSPQTITHRHESSPPVIGRAQGRTGCLTPADGRRKAKKGNATARMAGWRRTVERNSRAQGRRERSSGREQGAEIETDGAHVQQLKKVCHAPAPFSNGSPYDTSHERTRRKKICHDPPPIPARVVTPKNMQHDFSAFAPSLRRRRSCGIMSAFSGNRKSDPCRKPNRGTPSHDQPALVGLCVRA